MSTTTRWVGRVGMAAALGVMAAPHASAQQRPLPDFQIARLDGSAAPSRTIARQGQWLIVYLAPGGVPSDRLVEALKQWQSPAMLSRIVLLVDGRAEQADTWIRRVFGEAPPAGWTILVDATGAARDALKLTGAPTVLGLRDGQVAWAIAGVLNDAAALESPVRSWTER